MIEAMKQWLEALENSWPNKRKGDDDYCEIGWMKHNKAIASLRQAIEQAQKQEPVAWGDVKVRPDGKRYCRAVATTNQSNLGYSPLYPTPQPQREWVELTNKQEIIEIARTAFAVRHCELPIHEDRIVAFANAFAAKLKEKNL